MLYKAKFKFSTVLAWISAIIIVVHDESFALEGSYLVKSRDVQDIGEGLEIVSRFLPSSISPAERCQRYALAVRMYYRDGRIDQFNLARISLSSKEQIYQAYQRITMDTLRGLYIGAIDELRQGHLSRSFLGLVECLRETFMNRDSKARSYLNNKQLKRLVEQIESVRGENLEAFFTPTYRHATLTWDQLEAPVKQTIIDLLGGNESEAQKRFGYAAGEHSVSLTTEPSAVQAEETAAIAHQQDGQPSEAKLASAGAPNESPSGPTNGHTAPATVDESRRPEVHSAAPQLSSEKSEELAPVESERLLEQVNKLLHELYNSLPLDSKLADRCMAYGRLIQSPPGQIGEPLVQQIVEATKSRLEKQGASSKKFVPDANVRENFLFTVTTFAEKQVGDELWMDLVDCVSQWETEDERVKNFMKNPDYFQHLMLKIS